MSKRKTPCPNTSEEGSASKKKIKKDDQHTLTKEMIISEIKEVSSRYKVESVLGEGAYGQVFLVTEISTGQHRAMKVLNKQIIQEISKRHTQILMDKRAKSQMSSQSSANVQIQTPMEQQQLHQTEEQKEQIQQLNTVAPIADLTAISSNEFKSEISIMTELDHPNIVKIYEFGENNQSFFFISELISGGSLFDHLQKTSEDEDGFTEEQLKSIMKQILMALKYAHGKGVVHRDLKSENILFTIDPETGHFHVKIIDWGLSALLNHSNSHLDLNCGTLQFKAPEVLLNHYDEKCDLWSTGIIFYELLTRTLPFDGDTEEEIEEKILSGGFDLPIEIRERISGKGIDLLKKLLTYAPSQRLSASQALQHPWFNDVNDSDAIERKSLLKGIQRMQDFKADSFLLKFAFSFFALHNIEEKENKELTALFNSIDTDKDGYLTQEEISSALASAGISNYQEKAEEIMKAADLNANGALEYSEFLAAAMRKYTIQNEDLLKKAFNTFDTDGDGQISLAEVKAKLQKSANACEMSESDWEKIIAEADADGDKSVSFDEFKSLISQCFLKNNNDDFQLSQDSTVLKVQ